MRGRLFGLLIAAAVAFPASATAAPVLVLGRGGHVTRHNDRFVSSDPITPVARPAPGATCRASTGPRQAHPGADRGLRARASIPVAPDRSVPHYNRYSASFNAALAAVKRLGGTRASELEAVVENLHEIAAGGS